MLHLLFESAGCYAEVIISESSPRVENRGKLGTVLGISENDSDDISSYAVALHESDMLVMFDKEDVIPTGKFFSESDYYPIANNNE